jgi:chromosome segregation ATPase
MEVARMEKIIEQMCVDRVDIEGILEGAEKGLKEMCG